jgi:hypothetical protein
MRRTLRSMAVTVAMSLVSHVAAAQTCAPTQIQVHPSGAADLIAAVQKDASRLRVIHGRDTFLAKWDPQSGAFVVDLQGVNLPASDLDSLQVTMPGFRFKPIGSTRTQRTGPMCIGHYQADVSRIWRVTVSAPGAAEPIKFTYQPLVAPTPAAVMANTPADVPTAPVTELDWATSLKLIIYPVPKLPMSWYEFELHASDFTGSQCPTKVVDRVCHNKNFIVSALSKKRKRDSGIFDQLIEKKGVVDRIEFELRR